MKKLHHKKISKLHNKTVHQRHKKFSPRPMNSLALLMFLLVFNGKENEFYC